MSFFGGQQGPSPLTIAKMEAEVLTDMFNKMTSTCYKKCVIRYSDAELQIGEMTCVDRCVGKYMQSQEKVGEVLKNVEKMIVAQENAQAAASAKLGISK